MGAEQFFNQTKGTNANEAFKEQHEQACYEHGHGGYTGTIAEKESFSMSNKPTDIDAEVWVDMVKTFDYNNTEQKYYNPLKRDFDIHDDKWGDALCVPTNDGFIFCGWASN